MERREEKQVKPGHEFDHFFPKAKGGTEMIVEGTAKLSDTLKLIPEIVHKTKWQAKKFANEYIKSESKEASLRKLWQFIYDHIAYKKDALFKEQVRDFARTWMDRHNILPNGEKGGVDCDCYSTFISTVLTCLKIKHSFRITKYPDPKEPDKPETEIAFSHIYVIVPKESGGYWTLDCVVNKFNYEEPYLTKKDVQMDLEYLNGVPENGIIKTGEAGDFMGIMQEQEALSELGKIFKRKGAASSGGDGGGQKKFGSNIKRVVTNVKKTAGKTLHVVNKANPATVLLRAGILAGMKLNFLKIPESLRYTYLSEAEAKQKGLILISYQKLKMVREKLEKIFFAAGGQIANLKKAMLTGRGNRDKAVPLAGLDYAGNLHEDMNLGEVLGRTMYQEEFVAGLNGYASLAGPSALGELGEPATATSIAAASSVLASIAALIKSAGNLFPKRNKEASKGAGTESGTNENSGSGETSASTTESGGGESGNSGDDTGTGTESTGAENNPSARPAAPSGEGDAGSVESKAPTDTTQNESSGADTTKPVTQDNKKKGTFWEENKKWMKPTGIAVGSAGLLALIYFIFKPKSKPTSVNGLPKKKKPKGQHLLNGLHKKKATKKSKQVKRKSISLL